MLLDSFYIMSTAIMYWNLSQLKLRGFKGKNKILTSL